MQNDKSRLRELETWFQLILGEPATFENIKRLVPRRGCDACGRQLEIGQTVAAYPRIAGRCTALSSGLVQIKTASGDTYNLPSGSVMVIDDRARTPEGQRAQ